MAIHADTLLGTLHVRHDGKHVVEMLNQEKLPLGLRLQQQHVILLINRQAHFVRHFVGKILVVRVVVYFDL